MKAKALTAAAATLFALSAYAQHQQHQSGMGSEGVPRSSQSYPSGSTATPSGHSPGQGAGQSGSATADMHRDLSPGAGHGASAGAGGMSFSQLDRNRDGVISREEWNASQGGGAASGSSTAAPSTGSRASRGAPEPSSHAPAQ